MDYQFSASISTPLQLGYKLWQTWKNQLSDQERNFLLHSSIQNGLITWEVSNGKRSLFMLKSLTKKGVLMEGYTSNSGVFRNYVFTDNGLDIYHQLLLMKKSNIVDSIKSTKRIFPQKTADSTCSALEDVMKIINILEEIGKIEPIKSDNRDTLFWINLST